LRQIKKNGLAWCWLIFQEYRILFLLELHNGQPVLSHIINLRGSYSFSASVVLRVGVQVPYISAFLLSCPVKTCYCKVMYKITTSVTTAVFLKPPVVVCVTKTGLWLGGCFQYVASQCEETEFFAMNWCCQFSQQSRTTAVLVHYHYVLHSVCLGRYLPQLMYCVLILHVISLMC
jgi:hypothetical protein